MKATNSAVATIANDPFEQLGFNFHRSGEESAVRRRESPVRTFEAISQDRGVGPAFTSDWASASCRRAGLKRRKAIISGRILAFTAHQTRSIRTST
jgi:hypothetical protein